MKKGFLYLVMVIGLQHITPLFGMLDYYGMCKAGCIQKFCSHHDNEECRGSEEVKNCVKGCPPIFTNPQEEEGKII